RALNVYAVPPLPRATGPGSAEPERVADPGAMPRGYYLLDLPGYGWARASQGERAAFGRRARPGWRGPSHSRGDPEGNNPGASPRGQPLVRARLTPGRWPGVAAAPRTRSRPGSCPAWRPRG